MGPSRGRFVAKAFHPFAANALDARQVLWAIELAPTQPLLTGWLIRQVYPSAEVVSGLEPHGRCQTGDRSGLVADEILVAEQGHPFPRRVHVRGAVPTLREPLDVGAAPVSEQRTIHQQGPTRLVAEALPMLGLQVRKLARDAQAVQDAADVVARVAQNEDESRLGEERFQLVVEEREARLLDDVRREADPCPLDEVRETDLSAVEPLQKTFRVAKEYVDRNRRTGCSCQECRNRRGPRLLVAENEDRSGIDPRGPCLLGAHRPRGQAAPPAQGTIPPTLWSHDRAAQRSRLVSRTRSAPRSLM